MATARVWLRNCYPVRGTDVLLLTSFGQHVCSLGVTSLVCTGGNRISGGFTGLKSEIY